MAAPALTTETVMLRSLERGLTLRDFEMLTVGMIIDYIVAYNDANMPDSGQAEPVKARPASQQDYDRF
ncbi:MAG: hypothetical protein C4570_01365 [Ammonifex sp.]|nr:MAG: hypothetical protein C4570_01365 [Ammonifex sp.]